MSQPAAPLTLTLRDPLPVSIDTHPLIIGECTRRAYQIADDEVAELVENLPESAVAGWRTTSELFNPNFHSDEVMDKHRVRITYGEQRALVLRHATLPHLVRLTRRPG